MIAPVIKFQPNLPHRTVVTGGAESMATSFLTQTLNGNMINTKNGDL